MGAQGLGTNRHNRPSSERAAGGRTRTWTLLLSYHCFSSIPINIVSQDTC
eukprot:jgi/Botrbrau1/14764/Bobra.0103s0012.1